MLVEQRYIGSLLKTSSFSELFKNYSQLCFALMNDAKLQKYSYVFSHQIRSENTVSDLSFDIGTEEYSTWLISLQNLNLGIDEIDEAQKLVSRCTEIFSDFFIHYYSPYINFDVLFGFLEKTILFSLLNKAIEGRRIQLLQKGPWNKEIEVFDDMKEAGFYPRVTKIFSHFVLEQYNIYCKKHNFNPSFYTFWADSPVPDDYKLQSANTFIQQLYKRFFNILFEYYDLDKNGNDEKKKDLERFFLRWYTLIKGDIMSLLQDQKKIQFSS